MNEKNNNKCILFFFFFWGGGGGGGVWGGGGGRGLWVFQDYFNYIKPIVHQRWAKIGEPGEKPPDHP